MNDEQLEILSSSMGSAKETIKACLLINAGSAAALIAFMGHLATQGKDQSFLPLVADLAPSNNWFVVGAIAAIFGHGLSYLANLCFVYTPGQMGRYARVMAVIMTLFSIACFGRGAWTVGASLSSIGKANLKPATTIQSSK